MAENEDTIFSERVDGISVFTIPDTYSFANLKLKMERVDSFLWKRVMTEGELESPIGNRKVRVYIRFDAFYEGERIPYASTAFDNYIRSFITCESDIPPVLNAAVCTMRHGEIAQFIIERFYLRNFIFARDSTEVKSDSLFTIELLTWESLQKIEDFRVCLLSE